MHITNRQDDRGFTLIEVLLVLGIVSILTIIMLFTASGASSIATANQTKNVAQQNSRFVINMMERDFRIAGAGLYARAYWVNNGGEATVNEKYNPGEFKFDIDTLSLDGFMLPPIEVINGTDDDPASFFMQFAMSVGGAAAGDPPVVATSGYREPGSDVVTLFYNSGVGFEGAINEYTGSGQEMFGIDEDHSVVGARLKRIWDQTGGQPILVFVADDKGEYGTFKAVTNVRKTGPKYDIDVNPSHPVNSPTNMKKFLESIGKSSVDVPGDYMLQLSAASYFVYRHPNDENARGWLVRLDTGAVTSGLVDLDDPDTVRPYVLAENVVDFQVALGIDSDESGAVVGAEWHNSEDMEDYIHIPSGSGSASANFEDLVNNLRAVRFSVVTYTDQMSEDDAIGFVDRNSSEFTSMYPTVQDVADLIGIAPTLEDHSWSYSLLVDRLWYRRAVQQSRTCLIRNLDLENTFARVE